MNPSLALKRVETFLDLPAWFQWDFGEFRFRDLSFSSLTEGWLLLEHLLLHTVDGGCTWRFVNAQTPAGMLAKSIVSVEPGSCWIVLRQIEDSRPKAIPIAKCSADGGKLEAIWIGYTDGWFHLGSRLFFNGPSQGWLTANEHIDGRDQGALFSIGQDGQPWERLWDYRLRTEQTRFRNATCGVQLARNFEQDPTRAYRVVYNGDETKAALIGGHQSTILTTKDAGRSWLEVASLSLDLLGLLVNAEIALIVGESGTILASPDGGATWTTLQVKTASDLRGIDAFDKDRWLAVGDEGALCYTQDGGAGWVSLDHSLGLCSFHGVHFVSENEGLLVEPRGVYRFELK